MPVWYLLDERNLSLYSSVGSNGVELLCTVKMFICNIECMLKLIAFEEYLHLFASYLIEL